MEPVAMLRLLVLFAAALLAQPSAGLCQPAAAAPRPATAAAGQSTPAAAAARRMVAAAHPIAAEAGMAILRAGGNAIDAAVAVQAALAVVEPHASGLAGGALLLHWDAGRRRLDAWDGRELAPAAATPALFLHDGQPMRFLDAAVGGRAVGVPGVARMLEAAHRAGGALDWAALFAPAIAVAEGGFAVTERLAGAIAAEAPVLARDAGARAMFLGPDGSPPAAGAVLRNPALAGMLRRFASEGADALHRGEVAAEIVAAVRGHANAGLLTEADLAAYAPVRRAALCTPYRGANVCGFPPPSSGGVAVGQILGLLAHHDLATSAGADAAHLLGEAGRLAFADRGRYLGDADHVAVPVRGLLDPAYLTARAQLMDRGRAIGIIAPGNPPWGPLAPPASQPPQPEGGTSHFVIVDGAGSVVSMTTTIEATFGARIAVRGMLLNNELTDFAFSPEIGGRPVANRVGPGKRPRSSMSPTIVFADGAPILAVGSAGGARIIGHVAQTLVAVLDWGMAPQDAVALPRIGAVDAGVELEAGTAAAALAEPLRARGFPVEVRPMVSGLHAVRISRGPEGVRLEGGADPRRDGVALGE